jgi:hypothetical protein
MPTGISVWSTTANANGTLGSPPTYWPEGQAPSTVNDCARLMMASIRAQWNDAQWFNWGYTVTRVSGTSFTVVTAAWNTVALPAAFETNARIKLRDTNTLYGTITTVSVSALSTTVSFTPDSGEISASFSSVYNSIISPTNSAIPGLDLPTDVITQNTQQIYAVDTGVADAAQITLNPVLGAYVSGQLINFKAIATNTGTMTLQVDALGPKTIKKLGGSSNLAAGDVLTGEIVSVIYDGTNFQLNSPLGKAFLSQNCAEIYGAAGSGTDAYTITLTPALAAYTDGLMINFKADVANTGAATLNVNGLGVKSIKKLFNQDLATGDIAAGQMVTVVYDGTNFELQSLPATGGSSAAAWVTFTTVTTTAILASRNVTSLVDNATGADTTINFTSALSSANYSVATSAKNGGNVGTLMVNTLAAPTTTTLRVMMWQISVNQDNSRCSVVCFDS